MSIARRTRDLIGIAVLVVSSPPAGEAAEALELSQDVLAEQSTVIDRDAPLPVEASRAPLQISLGLRLEAELEWVDVEGKGGFSNRSTNVLKPEITSPYVAVDKVVVAPLLSLDGWVTMKIELRADDKQVRLDRAHLRTPWLELTDYLRLRIELGKNRPFVARTRYTEAYPLLGTAAWKGREYHLIADTLWLVRPVTLGFGLSVAMKRRLGTDDAAEDKSFKMLVYDDATVTIGNEPTAGAKLLVRTFGAEALAYGYIGKLIDKGDVDTLQQTFNSYRSLGSLQDRTHRWFGGRLTYDDFGLRAVAERLEAQDGLLRRTGWYLELAYNVMHLLPKRYLLTTVAPVVRWGELLVRGVPPSPREPASWDRQMLLVGGLVSVRDWVQLKIEYYFLSEVTGIDPKETTPPSDNQLLIQLKIEYEAMLHHRTVD